MYACTRTRWLILVLVEVVGQGVALQVLARQLLGSEGPEGRQSFSPCACCAGLRLGSARASRPRLVPAPPSQARTAPLLSHAAAIVQASPDSQDTSLHQLLAPHGVRVTACAGKAQRLHCVGAAAPRAVRYSDLGGIEAVLRDITELIEYPLAYPEARPAPRWNLYVSVSGTYTNPGAVPRAACRMLQITQRQGVPATLLRFAQGAADCQHHGMAWCFNMQRPTPHASAAGVSTPGR